MTDKTEAKEAAVEAAATKAEAKAAVDQAAIDMARGYREVEWKPGIRYFKSLVTGHTTTTEAEMNAYHAELSSHGVVRPNG